MIRVNKKNIKQLRDALKKFISLHEYFEETFETSKESYQIDIGNEDIILPFPDEHDPSHPVEDFIRLSDQFDSVVVHDQNKVTSKRFTQRIIFGVEHTISKSSFQVSINNKIKIRIVSCPILIGIAAVQKSRHDDHLPPCSFYHAIEVEYTNEEDRLPSTEEDRLCYSYIYELAVRFDMSLMLGEFFECPDYSDDYEDEILENDFADAISIQEYNKGMEMYLKAVQIKFDEDILLLYLYKILEHFAPLTVKIEANEKLRLKLDSPKAMNPDADFLQSVYQLTKRYDANLRDKDLIKSIFRKCVDIVDLFESLPISIQKRVRKTVQAEKFDYTLGEEKIDLAANMIGGIVYSTRNSIVHAKSNYDKDENECPPEDLKQLNIFLKQVSANTIKWYNRLPSHLKFNEK